MGQLLETLAQSTSLPIITRSPDHPKLHLYSVHDFSLAPILGLLEADISLMNSPPYASSIVIELIRGSVPKQTRKRARSSSSLNQDEFGMNDENDEGEDGNEMDSTETEEGDENDHENTYVRIFYNGKPLKTEWCNFGTGCGFFKFYEHVSKYIPKDPISECEAKPAVRSKSDV